MVDALQLATQAAEKLNLTWDRIFAALPANGEMIPLAEIAAALGVDMRRPAGVAALLHGLRKLRWLADQRRRREEAPVCDRISVRPALPDALQQAARAAAALGLTWDRVFDVLPPNGEMIPLAEIAAALGVDMRRPAGVAALLHGLRHQSRIATTLLRRPDGTRCQGFARRRGR